MAADATQFTDVRRILVMKLRHIGDVLLTAPVFRALKETFPGATVTALVNRGTEEMLTGNPMVDEIIPYDRGIKKLPLLAKLGREAGFLREMRSRGFDMTVDLTSGDRPALISLASGARYRLATDPGRKGFAGKRRCYTHLAERRGHLHTVLQNLSVVEQFGITTATPSVDFSIPEEARRRVCEMLDKAGIREGETVVHIHPTSRWLFKCWDDAAMAAVIQWLLEAGTMVVVTSSPERKELDKAEAILAHLSPHPGLLTLLGKTSLKELGAVAERADLFFGVDSAPMHIAAAVGTPVVALFGPSGVFHWGPWDNEAAARLGGDIPYPRRNGVQSFGRNTAIQRGWECAPCGKDGCEGSKVSRCLVEIDPDEVIAVLREKLGGMIDA
ncbi:MAG: putative lipopolysaccharide heptosyltransferase III [Desulfuromonadales bacterium]|nr:MAG: putative lipopolysaccharide heptosyltransferase III [Desulfuromonadales bacterium]